MWYYYRNLLSVALRLRSKLYRCSYCYSPSCASPSPGGLLGRALWQGSSHGNVGFFYSLLPLLHKPKTPKSLRTDYRDNLARNLPLPLPLPLLLAPLLYFYHCYCYYMLLMLQLLPLLPIHPSWTNTKEVHHSADFESWPSN